MVANNRRWKSANSWAGGGTLSSHFNSLLSFVLSHNFFCTNDSDTTMCAPTQSPMKKFLTVTHCRIAPIALTTRPSF
jgi:hypothetical protein